jgi:hypothetical protein
MSEEQQEDSLKWGDGNSIGGDEGFSFDYFDNGLKEYSESSLSLSSPYVLCSPLLVLVVLILLLA